MLKFIVLCLLSPLLLWLPFQQQAHAATPCTSLPTTAEVQAIQSLYNYTDGAHWNWLPSSTAGKVWDFSSADPNPCDNWQGITCSLLTATALCHINTLMLDGYSLQGSLPLNLDGLSLLTTLQLSSNPLLSGSIPASLGNITSLVRLDLYSNSFSGTIPASITKLTQLQYLDIYDNRLHGTIPSEIGNMTSLLHLGVNTNLLTGTLPPSITSLSQLQFLNCFENQLHGIIPDDIGTVTSLLGIILYTNLMSGTIPASLTTLKQLQFLVISENHFHGPIPGDIDKMTGLLDLVMYTNHFSGSIPSNITTLTQLEQLYLYENNFHGTIPIDIGNMTALQELDLDTNPLSGSIPASITQLQNLLYLYLFKANLHGTIPEHIGNLTRLIRIDFDANLLSGTIPKSITSLRWLKDLYLFRNHFEGSIPVLLGDMTALEYVDISSNHLSGTLPASITALSNITYISVASNGLTGAVLLPPTLLDVDLSGNCFCGDVAWMEALPTAQSLVISNNMFSSILPSYNQVSPELIYFQASENQFTGSIANLFRPSVQAHLQLIDLSKNIFTGSIPDSLFQYSNLSYVILAQNCFTGSIPLTVCDPKLTLEVLVLDGLHAASACQQRLFSAIPQIHTLADTHAITSSIPACLFGEMQKLQTLHMSGNGLTGSLPGSFDQLDPQLQQLSLSHNALTGSIPHAFQLHGFVELDLSFNQLTGELRSSIATSGSAQQVQMETNLSLNNNRLSGKVPSALLGLQHIDVLAGNIFACNSQDRIGTLPRHDQSFDAYMCGSDETDTALITCLVVVACMVALIAGMYYYLLWEKTDVESNSFAVRMKVARWKAIVGRVLSSTPEDQLPSSTPKEVSNFVRFLAHLQQQICHVTSIIVCVFMLCFGLLGMAYSTYTHKYVWAISIGYLSGLLPGACLFVILLVLLVFIVSRHKQDTFGLIGLHGNSGDGESGINTTQEKTVRSIESGAKVKQQLLLYAGLVLINTVVVMAVNAGYVSLIISGISTFEQTVLTIAMSLFKDGWRFLVMNSMQWDAVQGLEMLFGADRVSSWYLFACLFNSIVAPCIATAMVNTNCFYYAIEAADTVTYTSGQLGFCEIFYKNGECAAFQSIDISTSYEPPFTYTYQCSSTLLALFAPVWVYMFLFGGIITPLINLIIYVYLDCDNPTKLEANTFSWSAVLRLRLWEYYANNQLTSTRVVAKFDDRKQVVLLCSNLAIMISFGVLFPPIALVGGIAVAIQLLLQKLLVLDLFHICDSWLATHPSDTDSVSLVNSIRDQTVKACARFPHTYLRTMQTIAFYVSVVWGVFLWDIVGDEMGLLQSMWALLVLVVVGLWLRYQDRIIAQWRRFRHAPKPTVADQEETEIELGDSSATKNQENVGDLAKETELTHNPLLNSSVQDDLSSPQKF